VSLYFVSRLASRHVKVVLTGEGADELFAGYSRYRHHLINRTWSRRYGIIPAALRRRISSAVATSSLLRADLRRKLRHTFLGRDGDLVSLYLDNFYSAIPESEQRGWLSGRQVSSGAYESFLHYWGRHPGAGLLFRMLYADQKTYLVELLMKQDQMSMATSIESRVPFLDHPLVEFAAQVPDHLKIHGREGKSILKRAVEDLLPPKIVHRRKMGFPTPLRRWLLDSRAEPVYSLLRDKSGLLAAYVPAEELEALLARHRSGIEDSTDGLWRLLNLQLWGEVLLTGRRERFRDGLLRGVEAGAAR
jgi:asparagine synthase (glutamine-hydrolysing)